MRSELLNDVSPTFWKFVIGTEKDYSRHITEFYTNLVSIRRNELRSLDRVCVSFTD